MPLALTVELMRRLLVLEDNAELAALLKIIFKRAGLDADIVGTVAEAQLAIAAVQYAALVSDRGLPDGDGLSLVRLLRHRGNRLPTIILSGQATVRDRVDSLAGGADDFLAKPFDAEELVARVMALLRRARNDDGAGRVMSLENVSLNSSGQLIVGAKVIPCPAQEASLLERMMRQPKAVVPTESLLQVLSADGGSGSANSLQVYLHRLRRRLARAGAEVTINSVPGIGYMLNRRLRA